MKFSTLFCVFIRDRVEEIRAPPRPLPIGAGDLSTTDDDSEATLEEEEDAEDEMSRLRRNIARRKKLATPSPPDKSGQAQNGAEGGAESIYSSLSNEMYSKIGSPSGSVSLKRQPRMLSSTGSLSLSLGGGGSGRRTSPSLTAALSAGAKRRVVRSREELRQKLREFSLTSESGTASVLEVIEPTSSEEEEFKRSMREMNMTWAAANTTTTGYANGDVAKAVKATGSRRSCDSSPVGKAETAAGAGEEDGGAKKSFFQKIAKWKKKGPTFRSEPAGKEAQDDDDAFLARAEEHVLPDSFEDPPNAEKEEATTEAERERKHSLTITLVGAVTPQQQQQQQQQDFSRAGSSRSSGGLSQRPPSATARKSLSPQSRKSSTSLHGGGGSTEPAPSVATSDDSGIVLAGNGSGAGAGVGAVARPASRADSGGSRPGSAAAGALRVALGGVGVSLERSPPVSLVRREEHINTRDLSNNNNNNLGNVDNFRLGKIEEVSVTSSRSSSTIPTSNVQQMQNSHQAQVFCERRPGGSGGSNNNAALMMTPLNLLRKKSLESKAWYDVPSDDERGGGGGGGDAVEEEEADSLASIISTKGASSDED